jgi:hypothetical protein
MALHRDISGAFVSGAWKVCGVGAGAEWRTILAKAEGVIFLLSRMSCQPVAAGSQSPVMHNWCAARVTALRLRAI